MLHLTIVNQCLRFLTVLGAVIECKQYSGITVESGTPVKSVKITFEYICNVLKTFAILPKYHRVACL